ncbi:hypothetical protein [Paenibacillus sp. SI8]|uniref:hypothetical protein n=1 Tax=unclassified Paenibacillus TaxID=185978 RepID=UPI0034669BB7
MSIKSAMLALIAAVTILSGCGQPASSSSETGFAAFKKDFDKRTSAQQTEYFKTLKGTEVTWSGEVYDAFVNESEKNAKHVVVRVGNADFASFTLDAADKTDITKLNRGDKITIKGALSEQGGSVKSWILKSSTIVK